MVVGTAITEPRAITRSFADALQKGRLANNETIIGIDLGATNTKFALVSPTGELILQGTSQLPRCKGVTLCWGI